MITALTRDGEPVCPQCWVADTPIRRMRGLLGRTRLGENEGLLLRPASMIHTWFMRFSIDAVFLDRDLRVLRVAEDVRPWRMRAARGAKAVLELPAGAAARWALQPGEQLALAPR